jgi:hypothetical protein
MPFTAPALDRDSGCLGFFSAARLSRDFKQSNINVLESGGGISMWPLLAKHHEAGIDRRDRRRTHGVGNCQEGSRQRLSVENAQVQQYFGTWTFRISWGDKYLFDCML